MDERNDKTYPIGAVRSKNGIKKGMCFTTGGAQNSPYLNQLIPDLIIIQKNKMSSVGTIFNKPSHRSIAGRAWERGICPYVQMPVYFIIIQF